ncbi:MAG: glycosyltransferase family 4 protein [Actinomycetota bacterium]
MKSSVRVLFVQHASAPSGSAVSLGLLLRRLDPSRYEPILACIHPTPAIRAYYQGLGHAVIPAEGIREFPHTTGGWLRIWNPGHVVQLMSTLAHFPRSVRAAEGLIEERHPDIVHLNSLVLVPAAVAARRRGVPLVWHVRESAVRGHFGLRRRWLSRLVRELPDAAIFLSEDDMLRLGRHPNWSVIPNVVDVASPIDRVTARRDLSIPEEAKVVLFLGGYSAIKGVEVLLTALPRVASAVPSARCLLVGAHEPSRGLIPRLARWVLPWVGLRTPRQRVERALEHIAGRVTVFPWRTDVARLFAASDVLAFPSTEPHFPRPIVEAFAYRVPVVASDIGGVRGVVEDGVTGRLVPPGDPQALARALTDVLLDDRGARRMAQKAEAAGRERFDPGTGIAKITQIYERVLAARCAGATAR